MTDSPRPRNPLKKTRAPAEPGRRGEQPGKRTNEERNDPVSEPGAREGNPARKKRVNPD
ncbi:hypothetical protein M8R20_31230 [Pseudomonas sp. R2.Fl]|nr:hypothetical protein [Pseudomonas sp. R2.Fl]